jgi:hypothetical protein
VKKSEYLRRIDAKTAKSGCCEDYITTLSRITDTHLFWFHISGQLRREMLASGKKSR